jgi:molecular chaperone GrpE
MSKKRSENHLPSPGESAKNQHAQHDADQAPHSVAEDHKTRDERQQEVKTTAGDSELMSEENFQQSASETNAPVTTEEYEKQIASLKQEVEEFRDRAMRWQAELENYQKRIARQLAEERRYAGMDLIRDLLPVYDNLQRASQAAEQHHDVAQLLQGLRMIVKQWEDVFARHNCQKIDALHKPFDPNVHHAISRQATGDVPPNTVIYVAQDGFILHDRVVRPSQVVVSMALPTEGGEGSSEATEGPAADSPNNHPPS